MVEKLVFNLEILPGKADMKGILITKHWEEKIINHILQSDGELTNRKEESMERRTPAAYQVFKAFGIPKTFEIPKDHYWFQDPDVFQAIEKFTIRKLSVHPIGPTSNFPWDEVEEDGNCLTGSSPDLKVQNFPQI